MKVKSEIKHRCRTPLLPGHHYASLAPAFCWKNVHVLTWIIFQRAIAYGRLLGVMRPMKIGRKTGALRGKESPYRETSADVMAPLIGKTMRGAVHGEGKKHRRCVFSGRRCFRGDVRFRGQQEAITSYDFLYVSPQRRKGGRGDGPGDADVLGSWRRQRRCGKIKTRVISPGCPRRCSSHHLSRELTPSFS